jgi:hypothetical protein
MPGRPGSCAHWHGRQSVRADGTAEAGTLIQILPRGSYQGTPLRRTAQAPNLSLRADQAQLILEMESSRAALAAALHWHERQVLTAGLKPVP